MSKLEITPWRKTFWKAIQSFQPAHVCSRSLALYNNKGFYTLSFLNTQFYINPETEIIKGTGADELHKDPECELLLLSYLINCKDIPESGKWISEKEIPGGSMFFRGPHRLPEMEFVRAFGENPGLFRSRGKALGGTEAAYGDVAIKLNVLPRIPVIIILWIADDEFPARVNFLFNDTIEHHLPLDVVLALANTVTKKWIIML